MNNIIEVISSEPDGNIKADEAVRYIHAFAKRVYLMGDIHEDEEDRSGLIKAIDYIDELIALSKWDMSFKDGDSDNEVCPECACEIVAKGDGSTTCPECGRLNVLPCSICSEANGMEACDWARGEGCTPFPLVGER